MTGIEYLRFYVKSFVVGVSCWTWSISIGTFSVFLILSALYFNTKPWLLNDNTVWTLWNRNAERPSTSLKAASCCICKHGWWKLRSPILKYHNKAAEGKLHRENAEKRVGEDPSGGERCMGSHDLVICRLHINDTSLRIKTRQMHPDGWTLSINFSQITKTLCFSFLIFLAAIQVKRLNNFFRCLWCTAW